MRWPTGLRGGPPAPAGAAAVRAAVAASVPRHDAAAVVAGRGVALALEGGAGGGGLGRGPRRLDAAVRGARVLRDLDADRLLVLGRQELRGQPAEDVVR